MSAAALHVYPGSHTLQPADPGSIPAIVETWQGEESSPHRLHAQVPHHPQRHAARPAAFPHIILSLFQLNKHSNCLDIQDSCCTLCWAALLKALTICAKRNHVNLWRTSIAVIPTITLTLQKTCNRPVLCASSPTTNIVPGPRVGKAPTPVITANKPRYSPILAKSPAIKDVVRIDGSILTSTRETSTIQLRYSMMKPRRIHLC